MNDCIFCKIANGEINTNFIYEDENFVAFNDLNPKAKTHILIIPKKHKIRSILEIQDSDVNMLGEILLCCKKVAKKINLPGYNLQINVGKDGGQEIFHLHVHLMSNFA